MYSYEVVDLLVDEVEEIEPGTPKSDFIEKVQYSFNLTRDRSVYSCEDFAVRFCTSKTESFSNTVLSLSALRKYDSKPFIVVLCTPRSTHLYLANSTFIKKVSHSSRDLRVNNIKGSFNGSDIMKQYGDLTNEPRNFSKLFAIHQEFSWEENLERLVEATNGIVPHKRKFEFESQEQISILMEAPYRALNFYNSRYFADLEQDLTNRTDRVADIITVASLIENVNLRGRVIEELITTDDPKIISSIRTALRHGERLQIKTDQKLGDYHKEYRGYITETDIKTKVLFLQSAPKAFNIDKMLQFLSTPNSVYLFFLVGITSNDQIRTKLVSVFEAFLAKTAQKQHHWAGRNSRGVVQFNGKVLDEILESKDFNHEIDLDIARKYIEELLSE